MMYVLRQIVEGYSSLPCYYSIDPAPNRWNQAASLNLYSSSFESRQVRRKGDPAVLFMNINAWWATCFVVFSTSSFLPFFVLAHPPRRREKIPKIASEL